MEKLRKKFLKLKDASENMGLKANLKIKMLVGGSK